MPTPDHPPLEETTSEPTPEPTEPEEESIFSQLPKALRKQLQQQGIVSPTPIQQAAIAPALEGRDIVAQSQTGSGKTLAFAIPVGLRLAEPSLEGRPRVLILTPTRELAAQIESVFSETLGIFGLRCMHVIGGGSYVRQKKQLKQGIDIVVGTPGRIVDLMQQGVLQLQDIEIYILDEVDQMLDIGFAEELNQVKQALPDGIQTLFFSATMNRQMEKLAHTWVKDPVTIKVAPGQTSPASIVHGYLPVRSGMEAPALMNALLYYHPKQALIFCATREECREITIALQQRGFNASSLNGDMPQEARMETMELFRSGVLQYLVATNVAARGLDIQSLPLVINVDVPQDMEHYTHRSGRTGRAGEEGRSWTIITPRNYQRYWRFMKELKLQPERLNVPTHPEILKSIAQRDLQALVEHSQSDVDRRIRKVVDALLVEIPPDTAHELLRGFLFQQLIQKQAHHTFNIAVEEGELGPSSHRRQNERSNKTSGRSGPSSSNRRGSSERDTSPGPKRRGPSERDSSSGPKRRGPSEQEASTGSHRRSSSEQGPSPRSERRSSPKRERSASPDQPNLPEVEISSEQDRGSAAKRERSAKKVPREQRGFSQKFRAAQEEVEDQETSSEQTFSGEDQKRPRQDRESRESFPKGKKLKKKS